jgi:hypothetical protein
MLVALALAVLVAAPATAASPPVVRAGRLAGPVDVPGGSQLATVARLELGRGNWMVVAKGVIRNTTRAGTARPVRCRLALGGASAQALASPAWRGTDASRRPFLLAHAAHLADGGTARLQCAAPGSRTGAVVADDILLAAVRTAALFVRREGHSGTFYGNADAASQTWHLIGDTHVLNDDIAPVSELPLPAGRWAITATATTQQTTAVGVSQVYCRLDPDGALVLVAIEREGEQNDRAPIALQALVSSASAVDVVLSCQERNGIPGVRLRDIRMTAYRVEAFARQELDPSARFSPFGAWITPVLSEGWVDDGDAIAPSDTWRTVNTMILPAARWLIVTTADVATRAGGRSSLTCRIGREGSWDEVDLRLPAHGTIDSMQHFASAWAGSFDRARQIRLQCRSSGGRVGMSYLRMDAYQMNALTLQSLR